MRLVANLSQLFIEHGSLLYRYKAAANAGFKLVEVMWPYEAKAEEIADVLEKHDLTQVMINSPAGSIEYGGVGIACIPKAEEEFKKSIDEAIVYAKALRCSKVHIMSGLAPADELRVKVDECYVQNVKYAARTLGREGITVLIEPINHTTLKGYFLSDYEQALGYIQRINEPNVKLMFDFFHCQQICGQLTATLKKCWKHVAHVQVAQVPSRGEPGVVGEIDYRYVFKMLRDLDYTGDIGAEYQPSSGISESSQQWMDEMGIEF